MRERCNAPMSCCLFKIVLDSNRHPKLVSVTLLVDHVSRAQTKLTPPLTDDVRLHSLINHFLMYLKLSITEQTARLIWL